MNVLYNKSNLGLITPFERSQEISPNAPTLPMMVTLASFHVAGELSVNLRLRPRRVFPVFYGTYVLVMNVSKTLVQRKLLSYIFTACLHGKDLDIDFILMR